ncbi:RNA polymerase sigma factor [Stieleria varia]|uniref:RNA polymerase sigma factor n=1 Tax=Stieleria varia TaxID=2528005 RepID=A0A5C6B1S5_9BACT|nr:RNA polymerase sigma factor [Stieleria varia]TWU05531.1 RNA polymerase sigma factor [Stieleria varia]
MSREPSSQPPSPEIPTASSLLLDRVKAMEPESWSRLAGTFGPVVYRWCRAAGVSSEDAPDIVQNVFASVARGIARFERQRETGSFRAWLATITRSRVRDHFRKESQRAHAIGGTDAWQRLQHQPDLLDSTINTTGVEGLLIRRVLQSVEQEFEAITWQAFWQTTMEEKPAALVAETLALNIASVYQAKSRVLRRLRQRMAELPQ